MTSKAIGKDLFEKDTIKAARSLLGAVLVHDSPEGRTSGIIVETEAYLSQDDPACHASKGKTKRNAVMFGPPGRAYVYLIYGCYYCFNAVTNKEGVGEAVLIRALEPLEGLELMKERRGPGQKLTNLTSGPGKLCDAMGISKEQNGLSLQKPPLYITAGVEIESSSIGVSGRIGINQAQDKPWRFFISGNIYLSRRGV
jgi:DNA-3-methyladenine glycosylase